MSNSIFWQSDSWERFQKVLKKETLRIEIEEKPLIIFTHLFWKYSYGYIPRCPYISGEKEKKVFINKLNKLSKEKNLIFIKIDSEKDLKLPSKGMRKSSSVQPETTLYIDLNMSEEEILSQMKRKGRYNINLAKKKGVQISMAKTKEEKSKQIKTFYELLSETTKRDGFSGHEMEYYESMLETIPEAEIFTAYYEKKPLASAITIFYKEKAIYYYGASTHKHREVMSAYLLQWKMIKEAKKRGCEEYDFLGIAPENASKNHPWKGITSFKKKFGGKVREYPKAIDMIKKPVLYMIYEIAKKLRKMTKK